MKFKHVLLLVNEKKRVLKGQKKMLNYDRIHLNIEQKNAAYVALMMTR